MRETSRPPTLSDSTRWLGHPQEAEPEPPEWAGYDEVIANLGTGARTRFLGQAHYLYEIGVKPTRETLDRMVKEAIRYGEWKRKWDREHPIVTPDTATVYYLRVGSMIKIGQTTRRLRERLGAYPPDSVLLATETGPVHELEADRLWQFRADQALGPRRREWFRPSAALIAHINSLRQQPLTPAELAA